MARRHWFMATPSEMTFRIAQLEAELEVASSLLDLIEDESGAKSPFITELQVKWRALLDEQPAKREEAA